MTKTNQEMKLAAMKAAALRGRDRYGLGTCAVFERGPEMAWESHYGTDPVTAEDYWATLEAEGWQRIWTTEETG